MKKRQLENLLKSQSENIVPSVFDKIKDKINTDNSQNHNEKQINYNVKFNKKFNFKPFIAIAAAIIIMMTVIMTNNYYNGEMTTIYLDINPSFGLVISNSYKVIDVIEPDDQDLNCELELQGQNYENAITNIINYAINENIIVMNNTQYDNAISISALENDTKGNNLVSNLNTKMTKMFNNKNIVCEIIDTPYSNNTRREAVDMRISPGKLNIIKRIVMLDNSKPVSYYVDKTVWELNEIYKQLLIQNQNNQHIDNQPNDNLDNNLPNNPPNNPPSDIGSGDSGSGSNNGSGIGSGSGNDDDNGNGNGLGR